MEHSEAFRRKQYTEDHTLGHREFWSVILAEVRAEAAAVELAKTIDAGVADGSLHLNTMNEVFGKDGE
jgi:hypothetical protein